MGVWGEVKVCARTEADRAPGPLIVPARPLTAASAVTSCPGSSFPA